MSWISGLADKAENILNKIDQNAATALQIPGEIAPLDVMRKNLSNSSQSLRTTLSPVKKGSHHLPGSSSNGSVKSDSGFRVGNIKNSIDTKEKSIWNSNSEKTYPTRRNSLDANTEFLTVDIIANEDDKAPPQSTAIVRDERQELAAFKIALNEVSNERDELRLRLNALNRDIENEGLKQRAQELELLAQRLTEERDEAQHELREAQIASGAYVHSISELETNLAKLQQEYMDAVHKLQIQANETEQHRQDLKEYRIKAQRALQGRDNLIEELKANGGSKTSGESEMRVLQMEYDALKQEHQQSILENTKLSQQMTDLRNDLDSFSKQHAEQLNALRTNEEELRKELRIERQSGLTKKLEHRALSNEIESWKQQFRNATVQLEEKEVHVRNLLKGQLTAAQTNDSEYARDYDARIKSLTDTLVDKQNAVEQITVERNALRIQLEKVQNQLQQIEHKKNLTTINVPRNALLSNSTDAKAQFPLLMKENPFDTRVTRRVKRAYSSLDSAGIRLGAFLRRYPLIRIFVLMYVALLHIWVVFVLFSSTPN